MRERFPTEFISCENSICGSAGIEHEGFRMSVVLKNGICYGANGSTVDEAIANVIAETEKPRTDELRRAKELLESEGFHVTAATL